jgi:hypothetical protein
MAGPERRSLGMPAPLVGALWGTLLGFASFAVVALLWSSGATRAASLAAESALLLSIVCLAATTLLGQPARRRRARVPVNRAVPHQWWPREPEGVPVVMVCLGVPLIAGTAAAALIFR